MIDRDMPETRRRKILIKNLEQSKKWLLFFHILDANNLYGWAMSQILSVNGFKWVKQKNYQNLMMNS